MSNYKMITFDIDGTLVDSKKELSQANIDAMNKAIDAGIVSIVFRKFIFRLNRLDYQIPG